MKRPVVHIIGAGAGGLAAAQALGVDGRREVVVHESAPYPGGRRRTFHDDAHGLDFDTGNFPLISSWTASLSLIESIGARGEWREEAEPGVAFADFATGERWRLRPNMGRAPWWLLSGKRRGSSLRFSDFWAARRLISAPSGATIASVAPRNFAYEKLLRPLTMAALNAAPEAASAELAGSLLRRILFAGGAGMRVLTPVSGFGRAFVEPLTRNLLHLGAAIRFERRLVALDFGPERLKSLEFEHDRIRSRPARRVDSGDTMVCERRSRPGRPCADQRLSEFDRTLRSFSAGAHADADRSAQRAVRLALRLSRSPVGHDQGRRRPARRAARTGRRRMLARHRGSDGAFRCAAGLAHCDIATRKLPRNARGDRSPAAVPDPLAERFPGRRSRRTQVPRLPRKFSAIGRTGGETGAWRGFSNGISVKREKL